MSGFDSAAVLVAAGVLAGIVGTAGGITSLVSYPALLAVGVPVLPANVANLVALVACGPGAAATSGRELSGAHRWLGKGLPVAAGGAAVGSGLLLVTPPGAFGSIVPWLVLAGSAALLIQPVLARNRSANPGDHGLPVLVLVALVSVYGGYFGAGSGVMTLAVLLTLLDPRLPHANAMKNMLIGAAAVASAAVFICVGPVDWSAVWPLAAGLFTGSTVGPLLARHLPVGVIRWAVAVLGVCLALELWAHPS